MGNQNFIATILVDHTQKEAFDSFNNVCGWWADNIEGDTDKLNDEFIHH